MPRTIGLRTWLAAWTLLLHNRDVIICHVNLAKDYRGGERQTELLICELAGRDWQQRLIVRDGQPLAPRCADVRQLDIVTTSSNLIAAGHATKGSSLVHAHEARAVYAGWFATRVYGIPSILTRRVTRKQKASWLRDRAYRAASDVIGVSRAVADHVTASYPDIQPLVIADAHSNFPVDADATRMLRERYRGKVLIGHIGTYDHSAKGQLTIIEVAARAASERPDWHFLLLGAGKDEAMFRKRIGSLTNIELTGFVDNVGDYLSAFDLFVFPSLHEALGSSVLDAMNFGLPVVATRVGGIPEFIKNGVNGFLIACEAADELMTGIDRIVTDDALASAMHLANRAKAAEYDASRMADCYESIYRRNAGPG